MQRSLFLMKSFPRCSKIRNLEYETGAKILDRTALILEIFSMRAKSREGKLQVGSRPAYNMSCQG